MSNFKEPFQLLRLDTDRKKENKATINITGAFRTGVREHNYRSIAMMTALHAVRSHGSLFTGGKGDINCSCWKH
jgi:hypothetical protein